MQLIEHLHSVFLEYLGYEAPIARLSDLLFISEPDEVAGRVIILYWMVLYSHLFARHRDRMGYGSDWFYMQRLLRLIKYPIEYRPSLTAWKVASNDALSCSCSLV